MAEITVEIPDALVEEIGRRAAALGTTAEHWLSAMVQDVAADLPEETAGAPDDWIAR